MELCPPAEVMRFLRYLFRDNLLVEQMAIARWRIRRFVSAETVLIDCEIVRNRDKVEKEFDTLACGVHVAMAIRSLADESRCLSLMSRYEAVISAAMTKPTPL